MRDVLRGLSFKKIGQNVLRRRRKRSSPESPRDASATTTGFSRSDWRELESFPGIHHQEADVWPREDEDDVDPDQPPTVLHVEKITPIVHD